MSLEAEPIPSPTLTAAPGQPARTALAIFLLLFSFVGVFVTVMGLFADDLYLLSKSKADSSELDRPNGPLAQYRKRPDDRMGEVILRELGEEAFSQLDPEPYLESRLWRGMRLTMKIRAFSLGLCIVGAVLLLRRRALAKPILLLALSVLILAGAFEAIMAVRDGPLLFDEYRRDFGNAFRAVTQSVGLSQEFPNMRSPIDRPQPQLIRQIATVYYMLATLSWQILLLALVLRPSGPTVPIPAPANLENPCEAS